MSIQQPIAATQQEPSRHQLWPWILGILLITLCCYAPIFSGDKEFTNWDDDQYITEQQVIKPLDCAGVKHLFSPSTIVVHNYHPLTMLSLAIDYQRAYDEDTQAVSIAPFVKTTVIFHLLNTVLVFLLLFQLTGRRALLLSAAAAVIFGIHPLHVESVAWLSERKDVLYCCFFLLSCLAYLRYLRTQRLSWLGLSFTCFIASCLSKAMAVPLPLVLLLIDYLYKRKFTLKVLLEKAPFLVVSVIIGLYAITAQKGALGVQHSFPPGERLLFGIAALGNYCFKLIFPVRLSAYYPYPDASAGGWLPALYYIIPVVVLAAMMSIGWWVKRKAPQKAALITWGFGFFVLMIAMVLPFISLGGTIMAERYTYVSSIGLLFFIPALLQPVIEQEKWKNITLGVLGVFTLFCAIQTYRRIPVWDNSRELWTDVIEKHPIEMNGGQALNMGAKTAYKNLADYYITHNEYDSAFIYYSTLTAGGTQDAEVWNNLGNIYVSRKDMPNALQAFNKAIALDTTNADTYMVRAIILGNASNFKEAIRDVDKVLQLRPDDPQAKGMREDMLKRIH